MVAGSVAVMVFAGRQPDAPAAPMVERAHERPWLTPEAAQLIIGPGGKLGPVFTGLALGGPEPLAEDRERIEIFARAHDVNIHLDVVDHVLAGVRFSVTFGGCCGYEGADSFATRLERPRSGRYFRDWVDDWSIVADDGTYARTRVRVNRVDVRWEQTLTFDDMLERAEQLVGQNRASARVAAGDRWVAVDFGAHDRLELPYPYSRNDYGTVAMQRDDELGLQLTTDHGRISEVSFAQRNPDPDDITKAVLARWGRPHVDKDPAVWTWKSHGHTITVDPASYVPTVVIRSI
jgi:hypothetical protein